MAVFRGFPGAKCCPTRSRRLREHSWRRRLSSERSAAFRATDPNFDHTAGVFTTFPQFPAIISAGLLDQTIGTALLLIDGDGPDGRAEPAAGRELDAGAGGATVVAIGMSFGGLHGYAINPARDFGPRLFTGWPGSRITASPTAAHILGAIVGPIIGGLIGAAVYDFGIRRFLPAK